MMDNFENTFWFYPSKQHATIPPDYKTELDTTDLCNNNAKAQYRQYVGDMQWDITLGWIYIMYANLVLSRYLPGPQKVQLSNIQHIYGYIKKYTSTYIMFNIEITAYENFKTIEWNWGDFYSRELEYLTHSWQYLIVKQVLIYSFVSENLMTYLTKRSYQTGILHMLNNIPV